MILLAATIGCSDRESASAVTIGYTSVDEMLSQPVFYSAHRGGSANEPEMTLEAYEVSAKRHFGALEVSLARSADGVWFGLHDQTLDRTSQVTGLPPASEMSWTDINRYQVSLNGDGDPQPYLAWTELASAYGRTHVLFLDPKYAAGSRIDEFLDMVARDVGTERAVIKGYGTQTRLADAARARGFKTWGYYYAADYENRTLANTQRHWSMLGLNWDAPRAAWASINSYGKPVIAHVITTDEQRDVASQRGARGFQVADTAAVGPS